MARIRTIKPEFWSHPVMGRQTDATKCMALALLNLADDEGHFYADPAVVRSFARPFDDDSTISRGCLEELSKIGFIEIGQHPTRGPVGRVVNFVKHQRIDRARLTEIKEFFIRDQPTKNPRPVGDEPTKAPRTLDDESLLEGKGKDGKGRGKEPLLTPASPETFDGQDWCLRTCKAHPKWEAPDALDVPQTIFQVYIDAVDGHAKNFAGDLRKAAEDILARTRQFARDVADDKIVVGVLNFFRNGIYLEHQPERQSQSKPPMTVEEEVALLRAAKEYCPRAN